MTLLLELHPLLVALYLMTYVCAWATMASLLLGVAGHATLFPGEYSTVTEAQDDRFLVSVVCALSTTTLPLALAVLLA